MNLLCIYNCGNFYIFKVEKEAFLGWSLEFEWSLGIEFIPLEVSLWETVESLKDKKFPNFYFFMSLLDQE